MKLQTISTVVVALATASAVNLSISANAAAAFQLTGLTANNQLLLFDSATPGATKNVQVTGVEGTLLGIDRRPLNNLIYGLTNTNNIYTINPFTGAATFVSTLSTAFIGGFTSGVDFNPVPDRLRVVGGNGQNFRINVDTGAVIVDGAINPGDPDITAVAYTNADNDLATGTTLYDIDAALAQLFIQNPPNNGTLAPVGSLGVGAIAPVGGFDILTTNGANTGFAALTVSNRTKLFTIDLSSGAATEVGRIGNGRTPLVGLTASAAAVPEPTTMAGLALVGAGLISTRRKLKKTT
ncbi:MULTISPECIES: DUF4394 domain-containing protein [Trichocoleus]|uniref:DUF4394 domain-containing protein n=1 Tax=Trichocoleus desertorum GB2-A4 TaxID=2933944 RepID=A0ABV0JH56_9CYAN|nr:DUF4394 domain-containing protein [Trichocoleus sp. FACHB-46]MBD1864989.1 DUF4394 domain-containing protein [Trichocoleus sp. FACHB-46]